MLPPLFAPRAPGAPRRGVDLPALVRRIAHFWIVWSILLFVHEAGHAVIAWRQGLGVERVTVGVGPVLWRTPLAAARAGGAGSAGSAGGAGGAVPGELVLRLIPLAGITALVASEGDALHRGWGAWRRHAAVLAGGVVATLALAMGIAAVVATRERRSGARWVWGRILVADALVLTVFNFLPVPPLDGGRAVLEAMEAWRGAPLVGDARTWVYVGGLALAVVPMTLWTRWTRRIDTAALWWGAPPGSR